MSVPAHVPTLSAPVVDSDGITILFDNTSLDGKNVEYAHRPFWYFRSKVNSIQALFLFMDLTDMRIRHGRIYLRISIGLGSFIPG